MTTDGAFVGPFIDVKNTPQRYSGGVNLYQSTDVKVKEEELSLGKSLPLANAIRIDPCGSVQMALLNSLRCRIKAMFFRHSSRSFCSLERNAEASDLLGPSVLNE